jgi:hypothetical protein
MNSTTARLQPKTAPSSHRNQTTRKTTANNSLSNFCLALSCNKTSTTLSPHSGVHFRSNRVTLPVNPNHKTMVTSTRLIRTRKQKKEKHSPVYRKFVHPTLLSNLLAAVEAMRIVPASLACRAWSPRAHCNLAFVAPHQHRTCLPAGGGQDCRVTAIEKRRVTSDEQQRQRAQCTQPTLPR